jgi:hypothetical protein
MWFDPIVASAMGATLNRNGIEYDDALSGKLSKLPKTPFNGYGEREGR